MKNPAPAPLAEYRSSARWGLALALTLTLPLASAQTLMETGTSVGIMNTLQQVGAPNGAAATQAARQLGQQLQTQNAQVLQPANGAAPAAATPSAPATSVAGAAQNGSNGAQVAALPITPLSAQQQAQLAQARADLSANRMPQAQRGFEALIAQNYQQPEAHFGLALALLAQQKFAGAKFEFAQYSALAPQSFEGEYNLGVIAARQGNHDEALQQFGQAAQKAAQASPVARRQVLDALASEQLRHNDYAALVSTLTQARTIDPADPQLQLRLGQAMVLSGQGVDALPLLYAAAQRTETRADAASLIAAIYLGQNLPDRALGAIDAALAQAESDSERADLLLRKAQVQRQIGRGSAALTTVREAQQLDSHLAAAYVAAAELLSEQGDRAGSVAAWQRATQLDRSPATLLELAAAQLNAGQNAEARQSAQRISSLSKDAALLARAELLQGVAAYRLKDYAAASRLLQSSSMRAPSADTALWLGLSSYALKDYTAARLAFSDSLRLKDTPAAHLNLGVTYLALGLFKDAEPQLQTAVKLDSANAIAWYQLGLARRALGNDAEARASFRQAAQLGYAPAKAEIK